MAIYEAESILGLEALNLTLEDSYVELSDIDLRLQVFVNLHDLVIADDRRALLIGV